MTMEDKTKSKKTPTDEYAEEATIAKEKPVRVLAVRNGDRRQTRDEQTQIVLKERRQLVPEQASMGDVITKEAEDKTTKHIGHADGAQQQRRLVRTDWLAIFGQECRRLVRLNSMIQQTPYHRV